MKILVTGVRPFGGEPTNRRGEVRRAREHGARPVIKVQIPTVERSDSGRRGIRPSRPGRHRQGVGRPADGSREPRARGNTSTMAGS